MLVHGGAGDIPDSRDNGKLVGCKLSARRGYAELLASGSVLDAVEEAVRSMELDDNFNAGNCSSQNSIMIDSFTFILVFRLWFGTQSGRQC